MEKKEKKFELKGTIATNDGIKNFTKTLKAFGKDTAIERILTLFGSQNKLPRRKITIKEVKEVA